MPQPIKAAMLTPSLLLGGAERWICDLLSHSDPARLTWTGVAAPGWVVPTESICKEILATGTPIHISQQVRNGQEVLQPQHYDYFTKLWFLHSQAIAAAVADADVIVLWDNPDCDWLLWPYRHLPRVLVSHTSMKDAANREISGVTHLAGVADMAMGFFADRPGLAGLPQKMIYNGGNVRRCLPTKTRTTMRQQWGLAESDVIIGCLSRQRHEKNYLTAAQTVKELGAGYVALYYGWMAQHDRIAPDLIAYCQDNLRPEQYRLYDPIWDVGNILNAIDIFLLASQWEAFSLGLTEAWLNHTRIVATRVGCVPELEDKFGQLLVPITVGAGPQEVAAAITVARGPQGDALLDHAYQVAVDNFTCDRMARQWEAYLEEVVSQW